MEAINPDVFLRLLMNSPCRSTFLELVMQRFFAAAAAAALMTIGVSTMSAQSPSEQLGFGFTAGQAIGGHLAYALSPALHIGSSIGLQIQGGANTVLLGPYAKFLLKGTKELKPYFIGQFMLMSGGGATSTGLNIGGGGEYFITPNFGLFGQLNVVSVQFDPSVTRLGLLEPVVGIEWFFD